ncbi:ATP-binding cassette domain-containing protein [Candidatus Berkiella cookevillensis]|uniref:ATP-binding cassette domain-containing protein n=1 Tax=Candidatus Berkiella cookevillensis TaxID=437022 RepID=A0A0Q9Y964_9GAMM|nr:ATP-binding cassette domain-containing protein [Candidatus Berkiella cookevillensis]MCS5707350.1 ATP-binding cassette domain-containing protein [Candidatus Berkiella cookevillensis]
MTSQQDEKNISISSGINVIKFMWPYVWRRQTCYRKFQFSLSMLLIVATIFLNVSVPFLLKQVVQVLTDKPDLSPILSLTPIGVVLCYALFWGLARLIDRLRAAASFPVAIIAAQNFCLDLLAHLHHLSTRFHKDRKTGSILNIIDRSKMAFLDLIGHSTLLLVPVVIEILIAVAILTYLYDYSFGLILLNMLILYVILSYYVSGWTAKCRKIQNKMDSAANAYIVDSLLNAETVKYFDTAKYEENIAKDKLLQKEIADQRSLVADAQASLLQHTIVGLTLFIMTFYAGYKVVYGSMHVEDFVLVNGYVLMFMFPLQMLGYHIRETRDNFTVVENAIELFSEAVEIQDRPGAKILQISSGEIDFKDIYFGYTEDRLILNHVSFIACPGKTTAIVGASGSGKSTLSRLLFRLYELKEGDILIDGQSIKSVTKDSLRNSIGIVPQDTILFNDTLRNNIVYGKPDCSEKALLDVIKKSQLVDFVSKLPDGLQTKVGERGLKLSGGEKQRIAIARMLLKMPSILVFDEATSALDIQTEREIQANLTKISKGITTIIIAHRLSTIKHADNIIVLKQGEVVEMGNHQELIGMRGYYSELWNKQVMEP